MTCVTNLYFTDTKRVIELNQTTWNQQHERGKKKMNYILLLVFRVFLFSWFLMHVNGRNRQVHCRCFCIYLYWIDSWKNEWKTAHVSLANICIACKYYKKLWWDFVTDFFFFLLMSWRLKSEAEMSLFVFLIQIQKKSKKKMNN